MRFVTPSANEPEEDLFEHLHLRADGQPWRFWP